MIRHKLTLAAGFAAGYVLGTRAGQERYRQLESMFRQFAGMPAVQDLTASVTDTATQLGEKAKAVVNEKVAAVGDTVTGDDDVIDLGGKAKNSTRTTKTPMVGAAASVTAPEVPTTSRT